MRTRKEIEHSAFINIGESTPTDHYQLEVLLDIRELLMNPPMISVDAGPHEYPTFSTIPLIPVSEKDSVEEGHGYGELIQCECPLDAPNTCKYCKKPNTPTYQ